MFSLAIFSFSLCIRQVPLLLFMKEFSNKSYSETEQLQNIKGALTIKGHLEHLKISITSGHRYFHRVGTLQLTPALDMSQKDVRC